MYFHLLIKQLLITTFKINLSVKCFAYLEFLLKFGIYLIMSNFLYQIS